MVTQSPMIYLAPTATSVSAIPSMSARLSIKNTQWQLAPTISSQIIEDLAVQSHISPFLARLLSTRGYTTPNAIASFLQHHDPHHDPLLMHDMEKAARRIIAAIQTHQVIAVYGDFDADGITATSLICDAFRQLGANIAPYIPHRIGEGYGLNIDAIDRLADSGVQLLLTVDCGISNRHEVAHAYTRGLEVIVTDHHTPPADLPVATAVVNPRQPLCGYPDKGLVGVGVAYKLVQAIGQLGMPLPHQAQSQRPGIRALIHVAGLDGQPINAGDVGFKLAPRINAAGRLDNAAPAYELLLTNDPEVARTQAQFLNDINIERQQQTKALQERIASDIQAIDRHQDAIIVHDDPDAHAGLVGLVAARIADQFSRPTIIIERGIPHSRGSGRAGGLIDLVSALRNCGVEFVKMGGHAAAAGFTIDSDHIDHLRQALNDYAAIHHIAGGVRILPIDAEIDPATLDMSILTDLAALEPCGQHNNAPLLLTRNCRVISARTMGSDNRHLMLKLDIAGRVVTAVAWGEGDSARHFERIKAIDIVYQPQLNEWQGRRELRLELKDFRSARGADAPPHAEIM